MFLLPASAGNFFRANFSLLLQDTERGRKKRAFDFEDPCCFPMVSRAGLEPARHSHCPLKTACLPVPPPRREGCIYAKATGMASIFFMKIAFGRKIFLEPVLRQALGLASGQKLECLRPSKSHSQPMNHPANEAAKPAKKGGI